MLTASFNYSTIADFCHCKCVWTMPEQAEGEEGSGLRPHTLGFSWAAIMTARDSDSGKQPQEWLCARPEETGTHMVVELIPPTSDNQHATWAAPGAGQGRTRRAGGDKAWLLHRPLCPPSTRQSQTSSPQSYCPTSRLQVFGLFLTTWPSLPFPFRMHWWSRWLSLPWIRMLGVGLVQVKLWLKTLTNQTVSGGTSCEDVPWRSGQRVTEKSDET